MKKERINQEGTISSPIDCAKNSNTDQEIEIIEVTDSVTKEKLNVKILRDPSNYLNPNLNSLTDKDIYSEEKDSKNVPLINRIELYPNLPEDIYIPLKYICGKINEYIEPVNEYFVNKEGKYIINLDSKFRQNPTNREGGDYERLGINIKDNDYIKIKTISLQRTVSSVFLLNPKPEIYNNVNHIDHNISNNNLSNLEWVTSARNSDRENGCCNGVAEDKLMEYIAMDENGNEVFRVNKNNCIYNEITYNVLAITSIISNSKGYYKGYYWKRSRLSKKEESLIKIGCTGNIKDYIWYSHPLYPNVSVCKEGFVKSNGKLLCTISRRYVYATIGKGHGTKYRVNRLIMEFLVGRYLRDDELVDHINTNTLDNSFENLRIVDNKGNNQNKNTLIKKSTLLIVADLFGDFLHCGFSKDCGSFMGIKSDNKGRSYRPNTLTNIKITNNNYICINPGNLNALKDKMSFVFYVFKDNKLIDASNKLTTISKKYSLKIWMLQKSLHRGIVLDDGIVIKSGKDAVDEVISLGHGNAYLYKPNIDNFKEKPNIIDYSKYEKYLEEWKEIEFSTNQKPIKEFDLFGRFIKTYKSTKSADKNNHLVKCLLGEYLSTSNHLWCYLGEEDKIKEDLNYVFYKVDKDGNFIDAGTMSIRSIFKVGDGENHNSENEKKYMKARKYINTGVSFEGYYYQQGMDLIKPDPTNTELIPKRPILKWIPKSKRNNQTNKDTDN